MGQKNEIKTATTMQEGCSFDYDSWTSNVINGIESGLSAQFDLSIQQSFVNVVFEQCIPSIDELQ